MSLTSDGAFVYTPTTGFSGTTSFEKLNMTTSAPIASKFRMVHKDDMDRTVIVEVGDGVVGDDVSGAVDLDRVVAPHLVRAVRADAGPERSGPTDEEAA